jgi:hypothetical protein
MKRRRDKSAAALAVKARARAALNETEALKRAVAETRARLARLPRADLDISPAEAVRAERDKR